MENKNKKVDNNNSKKVENILNDINYGLNECDDKIDYFVESENGKKNKYYEQLSKEDFIFVIKNKIDELKKLLKMGDKNEK